MKLNQLQTDVVWNVLVSLGGVCRDDESMYDVFVHAVQDTDNVEFRFQGNLGFGGKLYIDNPPNPPRISCYEEDMTPAKLRIIENANKLLASIAKLW